MSDDFHLLKDGFGRDFSYLRISVTDRCNLRCCYCMPESGIRLTDPHEIMSYEEIIRVLKVMVSLGTAKVRITGGEPLIRRNILKLIADIAAIKEVRDLSLTTNGLLLTDFADDLKKSGLQRVNISLDSLREDRYRELTRGGSLAKVKRGIQEGLEAGLTPLKINMVVMKGINEDEIGDFVNLAVSLRVEVRFIEYMPILRSGERQDHYLSSREVLKKVKAAHQLLPVFPDNENDCAKLFNISGTGGRIGFISPISRPFCGNCNRMRLTANGFLRACLYSEQELNVKEIIRNEGLDLEKRIKRYVLKKQVGKSDDHEFKREMWGIGG